MKNKIILGTAQLGFKYGINNEQQVEKDESFRILHVVLYMTVIVLMSWQDQLQHLLQTAEKKLNLF